MSFTSDIFTVQYNFINFKYTHVVISDLQLLYIR